VSLIAGVCLLATASGSAVLADGHGNGGGDGGDRNRIQHVLLLSIDGMHAVDYLNCVKAGTVQISPRSARRE